MPRLSDSMEEGTIVRWLKGDGEHVDAGEEIVEIETDKATIGFEAELSGSLTVVARAGATVPVGAIIARIGAQPPGPPTAWGRLRVSPVARRLARDLGVELSAVTPTGPAGRIVKRDVLAAPPSTAAADRSPTAVGPTPAGHVPTRAQPLTATQATIARRMTEAAAIPTFTLTTEVEMDAALALRGQLAELAAEQAPSINDFIVKACALALRGHPKVNAGFGDGGFVLHAGINVGIAVAAADALLVPVIVDADAKSLLTLAVEARSLAQRARDGILTPSELSGATFTVSNLGMFGIVQFAAIVNPPEAAILAVGSLTEQLRLRDGAVAPVSC